MKHELTRSGRRPFPRLARTNLDGVLAFPAPPPDFRPLEATKSELLRYGYPLCPDTERWPHIARRWQEMLSRSFRFVNPQLRIRPERWRRLQSEPRLVDSETPRMDDELIGNWCGAALGDNLPEVLDGDVTFQQIQGQWVVPTVTPGEGAGPGTWYSSAWVGLDGSLAAAPGGQNDVLQGGTSHNVTVNENNETTAEYFAWVEWYPGPYIEVYPGLGGWELQPGDTIFATVWGTPNDGYGFPRGTVQLTNVTRAITTPVFVLIPPRGTVFTGTSAEWIVEAPQVNGQQANLCNFGTVTFTDCYACGTGNIYDCTDAESENINDSNGKVITSCGIETSTDGLLTLGNGWRCNYIG